MSKSRELRMSQQQESSLASDLGGRVQPASGAAWFAKSDVRKRLERRAEAKGTRGIVYSLKLSELMKIAGEALTGGLEDWVFQIGFKGQSGSMKKYAVIDWYRYQELYEAEAELKKIKEAK